MIGVILLFLYFLVGLGIVMAAWSKGSNPVLAVLVILIWPALVVEEILRALAKWEGKGE